MPFEGEKIGKPWYTRFESTPSEKKSEKEEFIEKIKLKLLEKDQSGKEKWLENLKKESTEINRSLEKVNKIEKEINKRENLFPVVEFHRIDAQAYRGIFDERDIQRINEKANRIKKEIEEEEKKAIEMVEKSTNLSELDKEIIKGELEINKKIGELREKVVNCYLWKYFSQSDDFHEIRTSLADDILNGVDHLILDRKREKVLAVIDVGGPSKSAFLKNLEGGARIKFGGFFAGGKFFLGEVKNVPVIEIRLNREETKALAEALNENLDSFPLSEIMVFRKFFEAKIISQFEELLRTRGLNPNLKEELYQAKNRFEDWKEVKSPNKSSLKERET
jgi:hypothetical protein